MGMTGNKVDRGRYIINVGSHKNVDAPSLLPILLLAFFLLFFILLIDSFTFWKICTIIGSVCLLVFCIYNFINQNKAYNNAEVYEDNYIIDTDAGIFTYPTKTGGRDILLSDILKIKESDEKVKHKDGNKTKYITKYLLEIDTDSIGAKTFRFKDKRKRSEVYSLIYSIIKFGIK